MHVNQMTLSNLSELFKAKKKTRFLNQFALMYVN